MPKRPLQSVLCYAMLCYALIVTLIAVLTIPYTSMLGSWLQYYRQLL